MISLQYIIGLHGLDEFIVFLYFKWSWYVYSLNKLETIPILVLKHSESKMLECTFANEKFFAECELTK